MKNIAHRAAMLGLLGLTALTVSAQTKGMVKDQPWMDTKLSPERRADLVLEQMTLDEKIGMLHGNGMARRRISRRRLRRGRISRTAALALCLACLGWGFRQSK